MASSLSSPPESQEYSQSFSQGFSQGDLDASQQSLGEEASTALVALGGLGITNKKKGKAGKAGAKTAKTVKKKDDKSGNGVVIKLESCDTDDEEKTVVVRRSKRKASDDDLACPELVVEGIVGKDSNGVFYSPQKLMFTYSSASTTHQKQVDKVLSKAVDDFNKVPDCFATRFKSFVKDYAGAIPSVVGGLTNNYKRKCIPTASQTEEDDDDEVVEHTGKRSRKQ